MQRSSEAHVGRFAFIVVLAGGAWTGLLPSLPFLAQPGKSMVLSLLRKLPEELNAMKG